jgi:hypothetical protein
MTNQTATQRRQPAAKTDDKQRHQREQSGEDPRGVEGRATVRNSPRPKTT